MANEIVKYNNDMNKIGLRNFNSTELDILMAIMSRMKNKGLDIVEFDFDYLKKLTKWNDTNAGSFVKALDSTYKKLISINFKIGDDKEWTRFVLFTEYTISQINQSITIGVNSKFRWVLNELAKNFTRFELEEFVNYKSSYTKEFFRRMKQYRDSGKWEVSLDEFKNQLSIPKNYRIIDIDTRVFNPIMKELEKEYQLKITKKYDKRRRGRPAVVGFVFSFKKEKVQNRGYNLDGDVVYETNSILNEDYYLGRTMKVPDKVFVRDNYLKIKRIQIVINGIIKVIVENQDDYYQNELIFDNLELWDKYFKKYLV